MSSNKTIQVPKVIPNDWVRLRIIIDKLKHLRMGGGSTPEFAGVKLTSLTPERLVWGDSNKELASKDLVDLVVGTANEIDVADDGSGGVTIGIVNPLIVAKGGTGVATLNDGGVMLGSGTGAVTSLTRATDGYLIIGKSGQDPVLETLTGTANRVIITEGSGTITISGPQDIHTAALPSFAGLYLDTINTDQIVYGGLIGGLQGTDSFTYDELAAKLTISNHSFDLDNIVFKPGTDSTTFLQVLDADGGIPVFNVDTTNERVGIGTTTPETVLHVESTGASVNPNLLLLRANSYTTFKFESYRESTQTHCFFNARAARGTAASPDYLNSNDQMFSIRAGDGYDDANNSAAIEMSAAANHSAANFKGRIEFKTNGSGTDVTRRLIINDTGRVGVGAKTDPLSLFGINGATPYLTFWNTTHEDIDGGRKSEIRFLGEQSGGERTTLAKIVVSHDGDVDDQKGKLVISTNDGSDGDTPTDRIKIDAAGNTSIGDAGVTNYTNIATDGDVLFVGTAGLAYGSMYTNADILVATASNVWKEVDAAQAWTTGKVHNCTFTDPKITVTNAGTYQVTWHAALGSSIANKHVECGIMIDSTITDGPAHGAAGVQNEGRDHIELLATENSMSGGAILQMAAGKTISLAVRNVDSGTPNITVAHGNITVIQIAGVTA